jgi:hemerythrin-like domain-containing protein
MQPTDILKSEHRVIEQVLECLEKIADNAAAEGRVDGSAARQALDFLQNFADRCHHGKEEGQLFPMMETRGFSPNQGPVAVMLYEHDLGREHMRALAAALDDAAKGAAEAVAQFVDHARDYVQLLRDHIKKEDNCLFPMADHVLTEADRHSLANAFARHEAGDMGSGTHEKYLALANELADRFHVPRAAGEALAVHGACCGHRGTAN